MQLLDDPVYRTELTALIQQTLQKDPVCQSYSHGQRWDALERDVRDHSPDYSRLARLRQTAETAVLRSRAALFEGGGLLHRVQHQGDLWKAEPNNVGPSFLAKSGILAV